MNGEQVVVPLGDCEIWFTQTHFAEIQELLKLEDEIKMSDQKGEITAIAECKTTPDNETENSGLSVYSVFVRGRLRRPVANLRNPGRILSDTALRGPGFAGVAVGEGTGSGGDRIKNSTTGIIFIKNNYLC